MPFRFETDQKFLLFALVLPGRVAPSDPLASFISLRATLRLSEASRLACGSAACSPAAGFERASRPALGQLPEARLPALQWRRDRIRSVDDDKQADGDDKYADGMGAL